MQLINKLREVINVLESHANAIKQEFNAKYFQVEDYSKNFGKDVEHLTKHGQWSQGALIREGQWMQSANSFPETKHVIELVKGMIEAENMPKQACELSVLAPGTVVKRHCGPTNHKLRLHLGIHIPENCGIWVAGEERKWQQGKVLVVDDSFEHYVWNNDSQPRAILIVDVWHPNLDSKERDKIRDMFDNTESKTDTAEGFSRDTDH